MCGASGVVGVIALSLVTVEKRLGLGESWSDRGGRARDVLEMMRIGPAVTLKDVLLKQHRPHQQLNQLQQSCL